MVLARLRHAVTLWRWRRDQDALKSRLIEVDDFAWSTYSGTACKSTEPPPSKPPLRLIGGLDISFFSDGEDPDDKRACVALIVCEFDDSLDDLNVVWKDFQFVEMTELYVPGYLAFREVEHYLTMLRRLEANRPDLRPDVILMDGNGLLHPRGFGVASHIGVLSGYCTIGVAKKASHGRWSRSFHDAQDLRSRLLCAIARRLWPHLGSSAVTTASQTVGVKADAAADKSNLHLGGPQNLSRLLHRSGAAVFDQCSDP